MDADDRAAQLYTLEYQTAAVRYENVYRSMWTIFSYLAAVAAGLLTFGSNRIEPHALMCIAATPLLFWFWTTYLPLDRYGNETLIRLGELEELLSQRFEVKLNHFRRSAHPLSLIGGIVSAFAQPYGTTDPPPNAGFWHRLWTTWNGLWGQIHRARFAILTFFIALHLLFSCQAYLFAKSAQPLFRQLPAATAPLDVDFRHCFADHAVEA